uniref:Uncharacterized protein n=1 Tax=Rhizophora mucronata TaxID=61149 RepID=A0A2P2R5G1_RHIMU
MVSCFCFLTFTSSYIVKF